MPDPLKGFTVEIAGKKRTVMFTGAALRILNRRLKMPMDEVIPQQRLTKSLPDIGYDIVVECLAAGLLHEDPASSDVSAAALLDADPSSYYFAVAAIANAWYEAQKRMLPPEIAAKVNERRLGEEKAPPTEGGAKPSPAGPTSTSSSTSVDDTPSTQS